MPPVTPTASAAALAAQGLPNPCQQILSLASQQNWEGMRKVVLGYQPDEYAKLQQQCGWYQDQNHFAADIDLRRTIGLFNSDNPQEGYKALQGLQVQLAPQLELQKFAGGAADEIAYAHWLRVSLALCDLPAGGLAAKQNQAVSEYLDYHIKLYPNGLRLFAQICGASQTDYLQKLTQASTLSDKPESVDLSQVAPLDNALDDKHWPCIFSAAGTSHVKLSTGKNNDFDPGCTLPGLPAGLQSWKQFESLDILFCGYNLPDQVDHGYGFFIGSNMSGSGLRLEKTLGKTAADSKSKAVLFQLARNSLQPLQTTLSLVDKSPLVLLPKDQCASFYRVKILMAGNLILWQVDQSGGSLAPRIALALPAGILDIETQKMPLNIGFLTWQFSPTNDQPQILFFDNAKESPFTLMEVAK